MAGGLCLWKCLRMALVHLDCAAAVTPARAGSCAVRGDIASVRWSSVQGGSGPCWRAPVVTSVPRVFASF